MQSIFQTAAFQSITARYVPSEGNPVSAFLPKFPDHQATEYHLRSHSNQVVSLANRGLIPRELLHVLHWYVARHDIGYGKHTGGLVDIKYFRANRAMYLGAFKQTSADAAEEASDYVENALASDNFLAVHTAGRVVPHAVLSIPFMVQELVAAQLPFKAAVAAARLVASHHFGFPLDPMVTGFCASPAIGMPLSPALRKAFMIGSEEERMATVLECAQPLGLSEDQAKEIGAWFFSLDRLTAMRRMRGVRLTDSGWEATDGESYKKEGFGPGNLNNKKKAGETINASVEGVYLNSEEVMLGEGEAAKACCLTLGAQNVLSVMAEQMAYEMRHTHRIHQAALLALDNMGLTGDFAALDDELPHVEAAHFEEPDDDALGYLAGTLRVIAPDVRRLFPK